MKLAGRTAVVTGAASGIGRGIAVALAKRGCNLALADHLRELAREKGCTPAQLALAWLLNHRDDVIPIPGTSNRERLAENAAAAEISLSEAEIARIEQAAPPGAAAGKRYDPAMMNLLNH